MTGSLIFVDSSAMVSSKIMLRITVPDAEKIQDYELIEGFKSVTPFKKRTIEMAMEIKDHKFGCKASVFIKDKKLNLGLLFLDITQSKNFEYADFSLFSIADRNYMIERKNFKLDLNERIDSYTVQLELKGESFKESILEVVAAKSES